MIWDGIVYRIFATGAVVGVVGVFLAAVSRKREDRIAAMAALSFFVVYTSFHLYVRMNPRVLSFEGGIDGAISGFKGGAASAHNMCVCI